MALVPYVLVAGVWEPLTQGVATITPPPAQFTAGATVAGSSYNLTQSQSVQAATKLNGYVGVPISLSKQRWYNTEGTLPGSLQAGLAALISAGCQIQLCIRPTRQAVVTGGSTLTSQQDALTTYLGLIQDALKAVSQTTAACDVTLWTEMNGATFSSNNPGVTWPRYWDSYAGVVKSAGFKVCYNPATNLQAYPGGISMFTGLSVAPDKFYCDWYGTSFKNSIFPDQTPPGLVTNYMALADSIGVPFGLAEWGTTSTGKNPLPQTAGSGLPSWTTYVGYIMNLITARLSAGKPMADIVYFGTGNNPGTNGSPNVINSASDFRTGNVGSTPGLRQLYAMAIS